MGTSPNCFKVTTKGSLSSAGSKKLLFSVSPDPALLVAVKGVTMTLRSACLSRFTPSLMSAETLEQILVSRHDLAADLIESIQIGALTEAKPFRLLIGPRGIGKTHMITLVYDRINRMIQQDPTLSQKIWIAWLREEEWGVASFLDLILRIFRSLAAEYPEQYQEQLSDNVDQLFCLSADQAEDRAQALLTGFIGDRTLWILAENLGDLFVGLGDLGQKQFRAYIQNHRFIMMLATAQSLFKGLRDRDAPFYGFFRVDHLQPLRRDEAVLMLKRIAELNQDQDLVSFLQSPSGQARVRAVHHLAGGNPRVYVIFAQFLTRDSLDNLVDAFMQTLDDLTPYYQARMSGISPQQRKIVELLVEVRRAATVKEIAQHCFMTHQTASSQLKDLLNKGYVQVDTVGRESFYQLREPLMRFCLEVKKQRGEPIRLFVEFLRIWYDRSELGTRYAQHDSSESEREYIFSALEGNSKDQNQDRHIPAYQKQPTDLAKKEDLDQALGVPEKSIKLRGSGLEAPNQAVFWDPNDLKAWSNRGVDLDILGEINMHWKHMIRLLI